MVSDSTIDIGEGGAAGEVRRDQGLGGAESTLNEERRNATARATLSTIEAAGVEVPWLASGPPTAAPPMVLFAGFGWRASGCVRADWFRDARRVVALDWPRRWPRRRLATMSGLADVYAAALDGLGIARAHLAGVSAGGMVALELAVGRPDLPASLTLVSTAATGRRINGAWRLPTSRAVTALMPPEPFYAFYRRWGPAFVGTAGRMDPREAARVWTDPMGRRKMTHLLEAVATFDARARLQDMPAPALVVHGRGDAIFPWSAAEELAAGLPHARLVGVDHGSHFVFLTHHARVARELAELWKEEER